MKSRMFSLYIVGLPLPLGPCSSGFDQSIRCMSEAMTACLCSWSFVCALALRSCSSASLSSLLFFSGLGMCVIFALVFLCADVSAVLVAMPLHQDHLHPRHQ